MLSLRSSGGETFHRNSDQLNIRYSQRKIRNRKIGMATNTYQQPASERFLVASGVYRVRPR